MKTAVFEIFRTGQHNGRNASNIHWSNQTLATIQRFYAESLRPAPLVVGHPENDYPEYGKVKRIIHQGDALFAEAAVSGELISRIKNDEFSGISISLLPPNAEKNPIKNLGHYLKHVGFLPKGTNPAVKGMMNPKTSLNFNETAGVLYFCEDSTLNFQENLHAKTHYLSKVLNVDFATAFQLLIKE